MKKAVSVLFTALFIVLIYAYPANAQDNIRQLNLKGAIDRAFAQNTDLLLINTRLDTAYERYSQADNTLDKDKRQKDIDDLENQMYEKIDEIELNVTKLYHEILIKKGQIKLQKGVVSRLQKEYRSKKRQVELGMDTEANLLSCETDLYDGRCALSDMEYELENLVMDLNIEMGDDLNQELELSGEDIPTEMLDIKDIDDIASHMADESYSVKSLERDIYLAKEDRDNAGSISELQQAEDKLTGLYAELNDEKISVEYRVLSDYNNILNKKDDVEIKYLDMEMKNALYDAASIRYNHGFITAMEYDRAEQDARGAMYAYMLSKLYQYIETKRFKYFIEPVM